DQFRPSASLPHALIEEPVDFSDHVGGRPDATTWTRLPVAVRPAIRQVLRTGDGEKTGEVWHGATDGGDGLSEILPHLRMAGAKRGVISFDDSLKIRA